MYVLGVVKVNLPCARLEEALGRLRRADVGPIAEENRGIDVDAEIRSGGEGAVPRSVVMFAVVNSFVLPG